MRVAGLLALVTLVGPAAGAQTLAARALADTTVTWVHRAAPGLAVHFLEGTYPARHADSLMRRLPPAIEHARRLIDAPPLADTLHVFFVENRPQMERMVGMRATGFADVGGSGVALMTHPDWRAFERHEVMHIVAHQAWGRIAPNTEWLQEGLAQFADGACGAYTNEEALAGLVARGGWIPFGDVLHRFRQQDDLRAYLQAAAFTGYLHRMYGASALRTLWRSGATERTRIGGATLASIERRWRRRFRVARTPAPAELDRIASIGCG